MGAIKNFAKKSFLLKRIHRRYHAEKANFDWHALLRKERETWQTTLNQSKNGPHVLIATGSGWLVPNVTMESMLAVALTLRKAHVDFLLCDGVLPACMACEFVWYSDPARFYKKRLSKPVCESCFVPTYKKLRSLGIKVHCYSNSLTKDDFKKAEEISSDTSFTDIGNYRLEGCAVGEHAIAGALRFFSKGSFTDEIYAESVARQYFQAALLSTFAMQNFLRKHAYQVAVFHHGIYVPQGIVGEVCRKEKVRVVNWNPSYRKHTFIFSHNNSYHHTMITEPVSGWENIEWTEEKEIVTMDYLKSRWYGTKDWIWFHEKPVEEVSKIAKESGIDFNKPCIGMLTNVFWDAQLHYKSNAFKNMLDWVFQTIQYFAGRPELQLIIRVHPAEVRGMLPSRQKIVDEINKTMPELPKNIFVIPPESQISTYAVMEKCNGVIIYSTKTGIEISSMGIPVIVAGEAWIRNKGFSVDASSPEEYFALLDNLPYEKLSSEKLLRARKYAYHFFFRRMIPLECMQPLNGWPLYKPSITSLQELMPRKSRGLDIICNGIINGASFVYPAERDY
jgi:hypothetical protein